MTIEYEEVPDVNYPEYVQELSGEATTIAAIHALKEIGLTCSCISERKEIVTCIMQLAGGGDDN
jgi:hypothetical protein